jgi:galactonate dehydratase
MKITDVETFLVGNPWKRWLFLRVNTSNGLYGVSEATLYRGSHSVLTHLNEVKSAYIGRDPLRVEKIWYEWFRNSFNRTSDATTVTALTGIEIACLDIIGKQYGAPIHQLLGGSMRDKVRVYANGWYGHVTTPSEWAERAKKVAHRGYTALKFDPFGSAYMQISEKEFKHAVEIVGAVRESVGDDVDLLIEGHGRFNVASAIRVGRALERFNPAWYEEPIPPENLNLLREVKAKVNIPIATGERLITKHDFNKLLRLDTVDVIQPDILNTGGILEAKKISAMAEANYVSVAPHQAEGPICTAVCAQLDACIPNFYIQESFDEFDVSWRNSVVRNPVRIENGWMHVPSGPGLGIDINEKEVAKHPVTNDEDFNLFSDGWEDRSLPPSRRSH